MSEKRESQALAQSKYSEAELSRMEVSRTPFEGTESSWDAGFLITNYEMNNSVISMQPKRTFLASSASIHTISVLSPPAFLYSSKLRVT